MRYRRLANTLVTAVPLTALYVLFGIWLFTKPPQYLETLLCIAGVLLLLSAAWIRFAPSLVTYFTLGEEAPMERIGARTYRRCGMRELARVFLIIFFARLLLFVLTYCIHYAAFGYTDTFFVVQRLWLEFYDPQLNFPLYRYLSQVFWIVSFNFNHARFIGSYVFACLAGTGIYYWVQSEYDRKTASRAVAYFFLMPGSCLLMGTLPDGLFVIFGVLCFLSLRKRWFVLANLFAMLASLTHGMGLLLLLPCLLEYTRFLLAELRLHQAATRRFVLEQIGNAGSFLLFPASVGIVLWYGHIQFGDAWHLFRAAVSVGGEASGSLFDSFATLLDGTLSMTAATGQEMFTARVTVVFALLAVSALCVALFLARGRIRTSYALFLFVFSFTVLSCGVLKESPRLLQLCAPLFMTFACASKRRWVHTLVFSLSGCVMILYFVALVTGYTCYLA